MTAPAPLWLRTVRVVAWLVAIPIIAVGLFVLVPIAVMGVAALAAVALLFLGAVAALDDDTDHRHRE
jgi:hypothetical protein